MEWVLNYTGLNIWGLGLRLGCQVLSLDWDWYWKYCWILYMNWDLTCIGTGIHCWNREKWRKNLHILIKLTEKHGKKPFVDGKFIGEIGLLTWYWNIYWNWNVLDTGIGLGMGLSIGCISTWQDWDLNILIKFNIY